MNWIELNYIKCAWFACAFSMYLGSCRKKEVISVFFSKTSLAYELFIKYLIYYENYNTKPLHASCQLCCNPIIFQPSVRLSVCLRVPQCRLGQRMTGSLLGIHECCCVAVYSDHWPTSENVWLKIQLNTTWDFRLYNSVSRVVRCCLLQN